MADGNRIKRLKRNGFIAIHDPPGQLLAALMPSMTTTPTESPGSCTIKCVSIEKLLIGLACFVKDGSALQVEYDPDQIFLALVHQLKGFRSLVQRELMGNQIGQNRQAGNGKFCGDT